MFLGLAWWTWVKCAIIAYIIVGSVKCVRFVKVAKKELNDPKKAGISEERIEEFNKEKEILQSNVGSFGYWFVVVLYLVIAWPFNVTALENSEKRMNGK